jgi:hypothetical protein
MIHLIDCEHVVMEHVESNARHYVVKGEVVIRTQIFDQ